MFVRIGVLLSDSFSTRWNDFIQQIHVPGAKIIAADNMESEASAASNLLWVFQRLSQTYSRTAELVKVFILRFCSEFEGCAYS
jgi:hypothetical protein